MAGPGKALDDGRDQRVDDDALRVDAAHDARPGCAHAEQRVARRRRGCRSSPTVPTCARAGCSGAAARARARPARRACVPISSCHSSTITARSVAEQLRRVLARQQQREALRRGDRAPSAAAGAAARAHAGDVSPVRDSSVHGMSRSSSGCAQRLARVGGERAERRDPEDAQRAVRDRGALARPPWPRLRVPCASPATPAAAPPTRRASSPFPSRRERARSRPRR